MNSMNKSYEEQTLEAKKEGKRKGGMDEVQTLTIEPTVMGEVKSEVRAKQSNYHPIFEDN